MTDKKLSIKETCKLLQGGENGHADLFLFHKSNDYAITSIRCKEGYKWCNKLKLWQEISSIELASDICKFLTEQITKVIDEIKKENRDDDDDKLVSNKLKEFKKIAKIVSGITHNEHVSKFCLSKLKNEEFMGKINSHPSLIPIKNNLVIDLKTGLTRERKREDYFTKTLDFEFVTKTKHADICVCA